VDNRPPPKIYTRTGDAGETGLFDGTRVSKADPRVETYGDVDELASLVGVVGSHLDEGELADMVLRLQRDLFALGSQLADPRHRIAARVDKVALGPDDVARLEEWIDRLESKLPSLRRFILGGGSQPGALLHLARAVCRRAERRMVALGPGAIDDVLLIYVNRLSDLLFVMARTANRAAGVPEIEW
jgi:cob(I)alamin adenosyltransferase